MICEILIRVACSLFDDVILIRGTVSLPFGFDVCNFSQFSLRWEKQVMQRQVKCAKVHHSTRRQPGFSARSGGFQSHIKARSFIVKVIVVRIDVRFAVLLQAKRGVDPGQPLEANRKGVPGAAAVIDPVRDAEQCDSKSANIWHT